MKTKIKFDGKEIEVPSKRYLWLNIKGFLKPLIKCSLGFHSWVENPEDYGKYCEYCGKQKTN